MTALFDPKLPPPLFAGAIRVFSTCRDCGESMQVTDPTCHVHPNCTEPPPSKLESLLVGWISCVMAGDYEAEKLTAKEIEQISSQPPELAKAAVQYASWGWPVFPLRGGCNMTRCRACRGSKTPCGKRPAIPKSKGGKGFHDATNDVERIARWWSKHPLHNIGLPTGHMFDVVDIDPKSGGVESFIKMLEECEHGEGFEKHPQRCARRQRAGRKCNCGAAKYIEPQGVVVTASGGMHLYVPVTGKGNFAGLRDGIDYRGIGGYVVGAPSALGVVGRSYSWMIEPSPRLKGESK